MTNNVPRSDGTFRLGAYPDCTEFFSGSTPGSVFVVGRNTPRERMYLVESLSDGSKYMKDFRRAKGYEMEIERISTQTLCAAAVEDLVAGRIVYSDSLPE